MDFYSDISQKQHSADRRVTQLGHIITCSWANQSLLYLFNGEVVNTNVIVFNPMEAGTHDPRHSNEQLTITPPMLLDLSL
jgi:hypothetical protein